MKRIFKTIFLLLVISTSIFAQLKEFTIIPEEPPALPAVFPSYSKKAALIIHSSITTLKFVSNTGGIVDNLSRPVEGKYIIIVQPENQYITVKTAGFRESKFPISGLKPRDVLYFTIEEKQELVTTQGTLVLNSIPSDANYQIAGYPISGKTPARLSLAVGKYKFILNKAGYENKQIIVRLVKGEVVSKTVELIPAFEIIKNTFSAQITDIKTSGGLINGARVGAEPDNTLSIYYNLNGNGDDKYEVTLIIKSKTDPEYEYKPKLLSGDFGEGSFAGSGRKIIWNVNKEIPGGFDTEGLYFELNAETVSSSHTFLYILGTAVLGGSAAYFLLGKKAASQTGGGTTVTVPPPPGRP